MTWTPVESTDVAAIGWEDEVGEATDGLMDFGLNLSGVGLMGVEFHRPPGSVYVYYNVPRSLYEEFVAAPSKGQFANFVLKRAGLAYDKVA